MPRQSRKPYLILGMFAAAALAAPAARAYDFELQVLNTTGVAQYGQEVVLFGGQVVRVPTTGQSFDRRQARYPGGTSTKLNFGFREAGRTVEPTRDPRDTPTRVRFSTSGNSALLKAWNWLGPDGFSSVPVNGISGRVLPAPAVERDEQGRNKVSMFWTFYNATAQEVLIPSVGFQFARRSQNAPATFLAPIQSRGTRAIRDGIVTGGGVYGLFGGAELRDVERTRVAFIPPRAGVVFYVDPEAPPAGLDRLLAQAVGTVRVDGLNNAVFFNHQNEAPICAANSRRQARTLAYWRGEATEYLSHRKSIPNNRLGRLVATGDLVYGTAQTFLDALASTNPALSPYSLLDALTATGTDPVTQARGELAALVASQAFGFVCPNDCVTINGNRVPLADVLDATATQIASGDLAQAQVARDLLRRINARQLRVAACPVAASTRTRTYSENR